MTLRTAGLSLIVPSIDILDRNGTVLATGMGTQIGAGDVELRLTNLKRGDPYFARVRSMNADFAIGAYRLALRSEQTSQTGTLVDPEVESNDSLQSASSMDRLPSLGGTRDHFVLNSSLSSATDVDYIRVRSTQPSGSNAGTMTITVNGTGSTGLEPTVAIYDHNFTLLQPTILVREAGEFSVQVPNIEGNRDYILAVQHSSGNTASGNYTLGVDIGGPAITLTTLASGTLTVAAPAATSQLSISTSEVLHLVLSANAASTPAAVRASIFNSDHVAVATAIVNAGQTVSTNVFLTPGEYQLLVGGGSTDGSGMPNLAYQLQALILSDPVGPQAVDPSQPIVPSIPLAPPVSPPPVSPPPASPPAASPPAASPPAASPPAASPPAASPPAASPPTVTISSPRPVTPTTPTQPNSPNILLLPPTDQPTSPTLRLRPLAPGPVHSTAFGIPDPNGSRVRSLNPDGSERLSFTPFPNFSGSLRVAEADFNNDGIADILVGTGPGAASQVLIVDGGSKSILVTVPAFEDSFRGGVLVAAGDLTGDGRPDIVITPDEGGGPRVRVLSGDGLGVVSDFFGIDDPNFRGGARATVGDLNADGIGDLVVAAGFAGGPRVASYDGSQLAQGRVVPVFGDFFVFEQLLRNGSFVAAGDINGDGYADLIAGGGPGGGPRVLILDGKNLLSNQYVTLANFFSGDTTSRGGIHVAVKDLDGDTRTDLVIGSGVGSQLTSYLGKNITTTGTPTEEMDINLGIAGGVFVG